jgi:hypothetical protein
MGRHPAVAEDIIASDNALCARDALADPAARAWMALSHIASLGSMTARAHLKARSTPASCEQRLNQMLNEAARALAQALAV